MAVRAGFTGTTGAPTDYPGVEARRLINSAKLAPQSSGIEPRPGVLGPPGALAVTAFSGMTLRVAPGFCVVPGAGGYVVIVDAIESITIPAATSVARWDLVVLRVRDMEASDGVSSAAVEVVPGTTTADPPLPSTRCFVLARILVGASVSSITSGAITDRRVWTSTAGGSIPIPGALASTPPAVGVSVGQEVWDETARMKLLAISTSAWERISQPARQWYTAATGAGGITLVGVSTSTVCLSITLPADAPAGLYQIDSCMVSYSDTASAQTYVSHRWAGAPLVGHNDATTPPGSQSVFRSIQHVATHSGGAVTIELRLQINGGTAPWNRSQAGTSLRVTYLGRA